MKILLLLLLVSCSSLSQKEPWKTGDCIEYRSIYGTIEKVTLFEGTYYYGIEFTEFQKDKILTKINCNSLPKEKK